MCLLEEEDSDARGASSFAHLGLSESEGGGGEEREAAQVRAALGVGGREVKAAAAAVVVVDGFPSMVMPWDSRACRRSELETLSHFCPPERGSVDPGAGGSHQAPAAPQ